MIWNFQNFRDSLVSNISWIGQTKVLKEESFIGQSVVGMFPIRP